MSPDIEIQTLQNELDAERKKVSRYASLIAILYDELNSLRENICHGCKTKLMPANLTPHPQTSITPASSDRHSQPNLSNCSTLSNSTTALVPAQTNPPTSESPLLNRPPSIRSLDETSSSSEPKQSNWSVVRNPEVELALDVTVVHTFTYTSKVFCIDFSPDGMYLAVGLENGCTCVYNVKTRLNVYVLVDLYYSREERPSGESRMGPIAVFYLKFSPDNKYIAIAIDNRIRIWGINQRRTVAMFKADPDMVRALAFSPDSRFLASTSQGGLVRIWCMRDGSSHVLTHDAFVYISVAFSPDGKYIAAGNHDSFLRIWDVRTRELVEKWKGHPTVWAVLFDGKGFVSGAGDNLLQYWDISSLATRLRTGRRMPNEEHTVSKQPILTFEGHTDYIRSVACSPDSRWLASSSWDTTVRIWDSQTGVWQVTLRGHEETSITEFSPAGTYLASGGEDGQVRLWRYNEI